MRIAFVHEFLLESYSNKDVVQVPSTLAKSLGCDWIYVCRPSRSIPKLLARGSTEFVGSEPDATNAAHLASGNEHAVRYSGAFALRAGWRAAATADIYIGMFLNMRSLLGVFAYRMGRLARGEKGLVYLKADLSQIGRESLERRIRSGVLVRALFRVFDWLLASITDIVSIETDDGRNWLAGVYRNLASKVVVVRNCSAGISHEGCISVSRGDTIVAVGRLGAYQKAIDILLPAFRKFASTHPTWELILVGESNSRFEALMAGYADMIDDGRIRHVGYVSERSELVALYRSAAIFVQPSRWEGFSIALIEAVTEGCLPVCTPVFCVDELLGRYSEELAAPVEDSTGLADTLTRLVAQRANWDDMRRYLLERTATWNWEDQLGPVVAVIRRKGVDRNAGLTTHQRRG